MSRGRDFSRFNAGVRDLLETDVGPIEDAKECDVGHCEDSAVYRVPWPRVGGDVAYCPYHLARYEHEQPEVWERLAAAPVDDPDEYAVRGQRFLALDEVPETIADPKTSFTHVCHNCQTATWWNTLAVLDGLLAPERGDEA